VTLSSLLEVVRSILTDAGVPSPRADAELLAAYVMGTSRTDLYLAPAEQVEPREQTRIIELARQRARRVPLQHVLGECEFMSLTFRMRRGVFIPRPETEVLVDTLIRMADRTGRPRTVLDMGTGCGVVAVSLARFLKPDLVLACDVSADAVDIASENAILNGVEDTVRFAVGDRAGFLRSAVQRGELVDLVEDGRVGTDDWAGFDMAVCNPPYVPTGEIDGLEPEVREHDPRVALDGGTTGTEFIDGIVKEMASIVCKGGVIALEIGSKQGDAVAAFFHEADLVSVETLQDLAGLDRVVTGRVA
jgi:release factor glutamine methyltransferase